LRKGLEDISYSPFETTQLFKQLEGLHLTRLRVAPAVDEVELEKQNAVTIAVVEPQAVAVPLLVTPKQLVVAAAVSAPVNIISEPIGAIANIAEISAPVSASLAALETFVVVSDEVKETAATETELPEGDPHLALVGNITQGSWFEMQSDDGQKFRCRLAAIIRATGKYIFVNRSGMKEAEETRMSLALALKSGRLHLLDDGMLFDRALEAVIGYLRATR
jgi:hypothetical protein